jgi:hypothetical protein
MRVQSWRSKLSMNRGWANRGFRRWFRFYGNAAFDDMRETSWF